MQISQPGSMTGCISNLDRVVSWSQELYESCQSCLDACAGKEPSVTMKGKNMLQGKPHYRESCSPERRNMPIAHPSLPPQHSNKAWQANTALHLISVVLHCAEHCSVPDLNDCGVKPNSNLLNYRCCWWKCMINHLLHSSRMAGKLLQAAKSMAHR